MEYEVIYALSDEKWEWFPTNYLLVIIAGTGYALFHWYAGRKAKNIQKTPIVLGLVVAIGAAFISFFSAPPFANSNYERAKSLFENQSYQVVEGPIEHFQTLDKYKKGRESFMVDGVFFSYSENYIGHYGFNHTSVYGGPIRTNGQEVRIGYMLGGDSPENIILKIELKK